MKINLPALFLFLGLLCTRGSSQNYYTITFDGTGFNEFNQNHPWHQLIINTASNPQNCWEIGVPQKTLFSAPSVTSAAIVTKTASPYPVNTNSSFIIKHTANLGLSVPFNADLSGKYFVNSDTLVDYGTIEFSPDNGSTWIDLINTTTYSNVITYGNYNSNGPIKPVLTGNSGGWKQFYFGFHGLAALFNIQIGDTVQFRFTFVSDGVQTNKDGLLFDDIYVVDTPPVGLPHVTSDVFFLKTVPNPVSDVVTFEMAVGSQSSAAYVEIMNALGQVVLIEPLDSKVTKQRINVAAFESGMYYYVVKTNNNAPLANGKFAKVNNP